MTHTSWNMSGNDPASGDVRPVFLLVFLTLVLLGFPAAMRAADEQAGPFLFASSTRTPKDIEIEAKVRRALRQDVQLRPLNLGVHMSGGIAKLSGPVPTVELKQRATAIVQHVDGVLAVSDKDLYISTSDQGGKRLSVLIQDDQPTQTRSASPGSSIGGAGASPIAGTGQQITLLAPEMAAPAPRVPEAARLTANPHPASLAVSLPVAIEHLRQRETRYQQIRARVQGATVYIFPGDAAAEDAMMFAQAVRRLPGVQHVILSSDSR